MGLLRYRSGTTVPTQRLCPFRVAFTKTAIQISEQCLRGPVGHTWQVETYILHL